MNERGYGMLSPAEQANTKLLDIISNIMNIQEKTNIQLLRKEGELLFLIKDYPGQPVKYYMNKSGMSARWFNEIMKQLLASNLVAQETCETDGRRKLLS